MPKTDSTRCANAKTTKVFNANITQSLDNTLVSHQIISKLFMFFVAAIMRILLEHIVFTGSMPLLPPTSVFRHEWS